MKMKKYTCECCGGTIDASTMKCEYCGVQYARDEYIPERIYKVEHYTNPVITFGASAILRPDELRALGVSKACEFAVRDIANKLAESIPQAMVISSERDLEYGGLKIMGTVKLVQPVNNAESWMNDIRNPFPHMADIKEAVI